MKLYDQKYLKEDLVIGFLGGCGEFGMNMTAYIQDRNLFIVDCGVMFPPAHLIGTDAIFINIDSLVAEFGQITAYIITHGHEDHIGAIPYLLSKWPAPTIGTSWTINLLEEKLDRKNEHLKGYLQTVSPGDEFSFGDIRFKWLQVNHSIPMACALDIRTRNQRVFHSGDFKIDRSNAFEPEAKFLRPGGGYDLAICDSTNANSAGWSGNEIHVAEALYNEFRVAENTILITTFASNLWRLLSIISATRKSGRKLFLAGAGLIKTVRIAEKNSLIPEQDLKFICSLDDLENTPRSKIVICATGSQAEHRASLTRIIHGKHPKVSLKTGDTAIFSSRMIPGNEKGILSLISLCKKSGIETITTDQNPNIHVSGHAHREELRFVLNNLKPRTYIPVHGSFSQLIGNRKLGELHVDKNLDVENGSFVKIDPKGTVSPFFKKTMPELIVDSWSNIPMSRELLRGRHKIGDSGLVVISGQFSSEASKWICDLDIEFVGTKLPQSADHGSFYEKTQRFVEKILNSEDIDQKTANKNIEAHLQRSLKKLMVKKPAVIAKVFRQL